MPREVLFGRNYRLLIGPRGREGLLIRGLRVSFKVEKSLEAFPNTCSVDIYNLSEKSRSIIEEKGSAMVLSAGYGTNLKTIFIGDIGKSTTKRKGADIVTTVESADGRVPYTDSRLDISFAEGARFSTVLDTVVKAFGLARGQVKGINENDQFLHGVTLTGNVREHLKALMNRQGLTWSIQDNQLQILPPNEPTGEEAVLLNSDTGLIGSPFKEKILNASLTAKKALKDAEAGTQIMSLMNGEIRPGRRIKVESEGITGVLRVNKCTITGDTHDQAWYVEMEAK